MNDPVTFVQAMRNPQQLIQYVMSNNQMMQNPIAKNTFDMLQKRDERGLEELARNVCAEKGINPDDALMELKSKYGIN